MRVIESASRLFKSHLFAFVLKSVVWPTDFRNWPLSAVSPGTRIASTEKTQDEWQRKKWLPSKPGPRALAASVIHSQKQSIRPGLEAFGFAVFARQIYKIFR